MLVSAGCGGSTKPAPITVSGTVENILPEKLGVSVTPIQVTPPNTDNRGTSSIESARLFRRLDCVSLH